jgi:hypoxanthine phosphoribosyltransferase
MSAAFVEVVSETEIRNRVAQLGTEISADYVGRAPVAVGVLKGSVPFMADLVRHLPHRTELDFLSLTRFGRRGRVAIDMDTSIPLEGRDVLLVEDIVDTGLTLTTLRRMLEAKGARDVRTVALLDKSPRRIVDVPVEYRGFEVGDEFLLGYGLDWEGRFRNVRSLWAIMDVKLMAEDPDAFARMVFPQRVDAAS